MDGTRSISELLAYLLVAAMAAALALPFVVPVFRRWVRTARASRMRTAISGALLLALVYMGGSLDKQQQSTPFTPETFFGGQTSLRTEEPPSQPQWYVDLGYPATDTDGDGIPDYWERRTHTDPAVADAGADPENDGVDNAEEFQHQCDPGVADTDGDGLTDHCISVLWENGGSIDLWSFLDPSCLPYTNALSVRVWKNGGISGPPLGFLPMGTRPSEMLPTIHNVALCDADGMEVYDRFWLVICSPADRTEFDNWYAEYSGDLSWIDTIPIPPPHLDLTTNVNGQVTASLPVSFTDHVSWSSPHPFAPSDHMHHDAKYELRSQTVDQHGNQATFDATGHIITTTIAAGTADYFQPFGYFGNVRWDPGHRDDDVYPYVRALQLDGNPGCPIPKSWAPRNISRPCIHQGQTLDMYLHCRPCVY